MKGLGIVFAAIVASSAALATPVENAALALQNLKTSRADLANAETKSDRMTSLSTTIRAVEESMEVARENMRIIVNKEDVLFEDLQNGEAEIAEFFAALIVMERTADPALILHPKGPTHAARSAMLMADLTPKLAERAADLNADLDELAQLKALQIDTTKELNAALVALQDARAALARAMSDRTEPPLRFVEDPVKTALLTATVEQMEDFVRLLDEIGAPEDPVNGETVGLEWPVVGRIFRNFNQTDEQGRTRPGVLVLTDPGSLVSAPSTSTVRYKGPLLDFGQVVILEPAAGKLIILAGIGEIFAKTGEVVNKGAPIGLMSKSIGGSTLSQDTLYIETRVDQVPVDPTLWFVTK